MEGGHLPKHWLPLDCQRVPALGLVRLYQEWDPTQHRLVDPERSRRRNPEEERATRPESALRARVHEGGPPCCLPPSFCPIVC